ncbi:SH3 domain-containing protein [Clostridium sp.]|uniref:SH3 domain-containing protein n=1 Tax=Clostridium sp. TaxID=1506 RepID=UPI0026DBD919|nr:SH3 domain-containing protein [Clostridium sp.]MDO5039069.1 SH3 domain-containing protein [Clostridium sp.]
MDKNKKGIVLNNKSISNFTFSIDKESDLLKKMKKLDVNEMFNSLKNIKGLDNINSINKEFNSLKKVSALNLTPINEALNSLKNIKGLDNIGYVNKEFDSLKKVSALNLTPINEALNSLKNIKGLDNIGYVNKEFDSLKKVSALNLTPINEALNSLKNIKGLDNIGYVNKEFDSLKKVSALNLTPINEALNSLKNIKGLDNISSISETFNELKLNNKNKIFEQAILEVNDIVKLGIAYEIKDINTIISKNEYIENSTPIKETNEVLKNDELNIEQKVYSVIEKFKYKHPIIVMFLVIFILSSIQSYIEDIGKGIIEKSIILVQANISSTKSNKDIKHNVVKNIDKEAKDNKEYILNTYRFVSANALSVRVSNNIKSNKICELNYGDVVKILKKNKNWSFIEYEKDDACIKGWVFTRYISRFEK